MLLQARSDALVNFGETAEALAARLRNWLTE
jgi:hypothetical protein